MYLVHLPVWTGCVQVSKMQAYWAEAKTTSFHVSPVIDRFLFVDAPTWGKNIHTFIMYIL